MESLPDDVWHQILQIGIQKKQLNHIDLCSLAIVNSHFDQLTQDSALWAILLSRDFSSSFNSSQAPNLKAVYQVKHWLKFKLKREFQREKLKREFEHARLKRELQRQQEMIHALSSRVNLAEPQLNIPDVITDE
ncbi:F-box protein SKIP24 [Carex littledalei]|uniref:F-box protein SKIP24 n=1 Tax=Carex littledalei TaxID=544730 RepID=A0A833RGL7_9POAL|nr:F-box protein SKIP24 [Carex littledalei]